MPHKNTKDRPPAGICYHCGENTTKQHVVSSVIFATNKAILQRCAIAKQFSHLRKNQHLHQITAVVTQDSCKSTPLEYNLFTMLGQQTTPQSNS